MIPSRQEQIAWRDYIHAIQMCRPESALRAYERWLALVLTRST